MAAALAIAWAPSAWAQEGAPSAEGLFVLGPEATQQLLQSLQGQAEGRGSLQDSLEVEEDLGQDAIDPLAADASVAWRRLAGTDALGTMQKIVEAGFAKSDFAILATSNGYWDALSASGLAGVYRCPIILTSPLTLSPEARNQLDRLDVKHVFIIGGPLAVSPIAEGQVRRLGCSVTRLGGVNAIETSYKVYQQGIAKWGDEAILVTAGGYWDALSIAPYAYRAKAPVLLVAQGATSLSGSVRSALQKGPADAGAVDKNMTPEQVRFKRIIIPGGTAAVSAQVETQARSLASRVARIAGADAYETSLRIANWCVDRGMKANGCGIATGNGYWDALVAGPFCGKIDSVMLLVGDSAERCISSFVQAHKKSIRTGYIFGGVAAVTPATAGALNYVTNGSLPSKASLEKFLRNMWWYGNGRSTNKTEYDAFKAGTYPTNLISNIVFHPGMSLVNDRDGLYPYKAFPQGMMMASRNPDPLGQFTGKYDLYYKSNGQAVEWIVRNIFNVTAADYAKMRASGATQKSPVNSATSGYYYHNGWFYARTAQLGTLLDKATVTAHSFVNGRYNVAFTIRYGTNGSYHYRHLHAQLAYKTIDGRQYWTIYKLSSKPIA